MWARRLRLRALIPHAAQVRNLYGLAWAKPSNWPHTCRRIMELVSGSPHSTHGLRLPWPISAVCVWIWASMSRPMKE